MIINQSKAHIGSASLFSQPNFTEMNQTQMNTSRVQKQSNDYSTQVL